MKNKRMRIHTSYGVLPNIIVFIILYTFVISKLYLTQFLNEFLSVMIYAVFIGLFFLYCKKYINSVTILYHLGFIYLKRPQRLLMFSTYYVIHLLLFCYLTPMLTIFSIQFLVGVWIFCLLLIEFLLYKYKFFVTFVRITPRLYVDLIHRQVHTKEDIKTYDITGHYVEDLDFTTIDLLKDLFHYSQYHRNYFKGKIDYIDYSYEDGSKYYNLKAYDKDGSLIWDEHFTNSGKSIPDELVPFFVEIIMDIENL